VASGTASGRPGRLRRRWCVRAAVGAGECSRLCDAYASVHACAPLSLLSTPSAAAPRSQVGDFNAWDASAAPCAKDAFGVWSCFLPDGPGGAPAIPHQSRVKVCLLLGSGERAFRLPAWTRRAVYDEAVNEYTAEYWDPPAAERHVWKHPRPATHVACDYRKVWGGGA
jgi:hypothetical protein